MPNPDHTSRLEDLQLCLSTESIVALTRAKGGQRIYIPADIDADHWLAELLGLDDARALSDYFCTNGGTQIIVPMIHGGNRAERRRRVQKMLDEGKTLNEIAAALNIAYSTAEYHAGRARKRRNNSGPDLFSQ